jgi:hypothetical protein
MLGGHVSPARGQRGASPASPPHHGRFPSAFDNPLFRLLSQAWFWGALGLIVGPCLLFRGLQMLRLKRLVADTPRSTARAAAIGNVELAGAACGPYVLAAPLSKKIVSTTASSCGCAATTGASASSKRNSRRFSSTTAPDTCWLIRAARD